jgi:tetratricopeptide (TPR) repeat protein
MSKKGIHQMTDITNRVIPEPKNWQDFERLCYDLYRRMSKTSDAEMNGRQGQPQAGVDVYGTDRVENRFVGVQCKGKDQGYGAELTGTELRAEIEKAKTFDPPVDVFIVATTAPNNIKIQQLARTITRKHAEQGLFEVRVQGCGTLQQWVTDDRELFSKHFPDLAPFDIVGRLDAGFALSESRDEQILTQIAGLRSQLTASTERSDSSDPLQTRIIDAAKLIDDGSAQAALRLLDRILKDEGSRLSPRNLFRLHSGIGFAHMALGDLPAAIQYFRNAYGADPEWPNARAILAIAELLEGNTAWAFERAKQALADDPSSYHAAAVIIDTAPKEVGVATLEALIPIGLRDRVDSNRSVRPP